MAGVVVVAIMAIGIVMTFDAVEYLDADCCPGSDGVGDDGVDVGDDAGDNHVGVDGVGCCGDGALLWAMAMAMMCSIV